MAILPEGVVVKIVSVMRGNEKKIASQHRKNKIVPNRSVFFDWMHREDAKDYGDIENPDGTETVFSRIKIGE